MIPVSPDLGLEDCLNGNFLSGVIEGFYGKPWTTDQRKKLFRRMKKMGLNTYLYAPKDDLKHRACWRDMYSVEEADNLMGLIENAQENNVMFVYALSPGIDINFSSTKDVTMLKRKLEQVSSFGCKSFALLFDDIETDMCESDKEIFQSFAHAQVSVTNEVYQHLNQPKFLFCPTEYCASRAVPNVSASEYLNTLGSKLLPGIDILWTGPKVVSKKISVKSVEEITNVLQRPPVIWDNIHANDYDHKRLFLGPYDGRSPELIPYLRGVMTNPNCEFEANYIAMHTLAQWCRSNVGGSKKDVILSESPVTAVIKLETENDYSSDEDLPGYLHPSYKPRQALTVAITDWIEEFQSECLPVSEGLQSVKSTSEIIVPIVPEVSNCNEVPIMYSQPIAVPGAPVKNINELNQLEVNDSFVQPGLSLNLINSFVSESSSDSDSSTEQLEPMDCVVTPGSTPASSDGIAVTTLIDIKEETVDTIDTEFKPETTEVMQVDSLVYSSIPCSSNTPCLLADSNKSKLSNSLGLSLTGDDVKLLVDLFYLPFDHGSFAVELLTDVLWIKINIHLLQLQESSVPEHKLLAMEWREKANKVQNQITAVISMIDRLCIIPNKSIVNDLFPYLWDMKGILSLLNPFIDWLALGHVPYQNLVNLQGSPYSWSNKMYRDAFHNGDQEPWVFRGGLQAEFQRLLLLDNASDLFILPVPPVALNEMCVIRPYSASDEMGVYDVCRNSYTDSREGTDFLSQPDLVPDRLVGSFITNSPEHCFVIEDEEGICGYICCALDANIFHRKTEIAWLPFMQEKYPSPATEQPLNPSQEFIASFHDYQPLSSKNVQGRFPSLIRINVLNRCKDVSAPKRAFACAIAALKANGSLGVHIELMGGERETPSLEFYAKLGFVSVALPDEQPQCELVTALGRAL